MTSKTFEIIPAIDLLDGRVVRLSQGKRDECTVYSDDPVGFAKSFERAGARRLHVVDLNGAFDGKFGNLDLVRAICDSTSLRIELGGGVRSIKDAQRAWSAGVADVIVGTQAAENEDFIRELVEGHSGQFIVGIDARDGMVATKGWTESGSVSALDLAARMQEMGVPRIIYTDISTDGMLSGPNVASLTEMARAVPEVEVVASGGVSSLEDIETLLAEREDNVVGVITGRALYDGRLDLARAVQLCLQNA